MGAETFADREAARELLRGIVEERYPSTDYRRLVEDDFLPGFSGGWVLEHEGGFCLMRVPSVDPTIISIRAGAAVEIPRSEELAYYVACENKKVMAGRAYLGYGEAVAMVVVEEVVWGRALSWGFDPSLSDMLGRFESVMKKANEIRSVLLPRFGGRPFAGDDWMHLVQ